MPPPTCRRDSAKSRLPPLPSFNPLPGAAARRTRLRRRRRASAPASRRPPPPPAAPRTCERWRRPRRPGRRRGSTVVVSVGEAEVSENERHRNFGAKSNNAAPSQKKRTAAKSSSSTSSVFSSRLAMSCCGGSGRRRRAKSECREGGCFSFASQFFVSMRGGCRRFPPPHTRLSPHTHQLAQVLQLIGLRVQVVGQEGLQFF